MSCSSETERQRWLHVTEPPLSENPDEKVYEQWDCPQVIAKHTYLGLQPDELNLDPGDVVNVTRKMADGNIINEKAFSFSQLTKLYSRTYLLCYPFVLTLIIDCNTLCSTHKSS